MSITVCRGQAVVGIRPCSATNPTHTAEPVVENNRHYYPRLRVETWNGIAWVASRRRDGSTYTATGSERVRLTYTWERKGFSVIVR